MEIVRHGLPKEQLNKIYFECGRCGCIFTYNKDEDGYEDYHSGKYWSRCPDCDNFAVSDKTLSRYVVGPPKYFPATAEEKAGVGWIKYMLERFGQFGDDSTATGDNR